MQVNNELLKYTLKKNIQASVENRQIDISSIPAKQTSVSALNKPEADTLNIGGKDIELSGVMSDEEYLKAVKELKARQLSGSNLVTKLTVDDLKSDIYQSEISDIKTAIYKYHNGGSISPSENINDYSAFLTNDSFKGVDELVSWLKGNSAWNEEKKGLPVSNLVKLTQNDELEDNNKDFFGLLNRAFSNHVDSSGNIYTEASLNLDEDASIISYDELKQFFIGIEDYSAYQSKVQTYSDALQAEYETLDLQGKLDFAIAKTREYLEASDMQPQIKALDRLLGMEDKNPNAMAARGNITLSDLNNGDVSDSMNCGAYNYLAYMGEYKTPDNKTYDIKDWSEDNDSSENDLGIGLDYRVAVGADGYDFGNWYDLVDTLVHELTHATAYMYYWYDEPDANGNMNYGITDEGLAQLKEIGALDGVDTDNLTFEDWEYLAYTAWGEYYAYQKDADYLDSIGQDVISGSGMAVDGKDEKDTIIKHINDLYNSDTYTEAVPNWKWWSYA